MRYKILKKATSAANGGGEPPIKHATQEGAVLRAIQRTQPDATKAAILKAARRAFKPTKADPDGASRLGFYLVKLQDKGLISAH